MSTLAGHYADYDREIVKDLSDAELAQRREQVLRLREQADAQLLERLPELTATAHQLLAEGRLRALRLILLDIARMSLGSSAVLLHDCCLALAEELTAISLPLPRESCGPKSGTQVVSAPVQLMLDECSRLLANREPPARELIEYVESFWQDGPASVQGGSDA